jgi:hypothetical protein
MCGASLQLSIVSHAKPSQIALHYSSSSESVQTVLNDVRSQGVKATAIKADANATDFGTVLVDAVSECAFVVV